MSAPTFAVIRVPDFRLQAVLRHEPELRERAVVLVEELISKARHDAPNLTRNHDGEDAERTAKAHILHVTARAREAGVQPGMTASQAQARCRDLLVRGRSPGAEQSAQAALLDFAFSLASYVEDTAPGVVTLDLKEAGAWRQRFLQDVEFDPFDQNDSDDLFSHSARTAHPVFDHLRALGLDAHFGFGPTPDLALLASHRSGHVGVAESASDLASLPLEAATSSTAMRQLLHRWGIRTLGGFTALGRDDLVRRLGVEAGDLFDRASGHTSRPLRCTLPSETFEESAEFENAVETLEPLLFLLRRFVEQLVQRLAAIYRVPATLRLRLDLADGSTHERVFKIPSPTGCVETLFRMLHTHLESLTTEHPIHGARLTAEPTQPVRQQFGLFESALRDPNQFAETLARLAALLGADRVGTPVLEPSHRADAFRMQPADFESERPGPTIETHPPGLALRRFRPARRALVQMEDGPAYVHSADVTGRVVATHGPMLLSGDWWSEAPWHRAEWDVQLADHRLVRIYEQDRAWFVEGIYD